MIPSKINDCIPSVSFCAIAHLIPIQRIYMSSFMSILSVERIDETNLTRIVI